MENKNLCTCVGDASILASGHPCTEQVFRGKVSCLDDAIRINEFKTGLCEDKLVMFIGGKKEFMPSESSDYRKLSFSPINKAHAIVEVVIFFNFFPEFDQSAIKKLADLEYELKEELPKSNQVRKLQTTFEAGPEGRPAFKTPEERLSGIELQSIKKDGALEWMLRTTENTISVHCLDYSTWKEVWEKAKNYFYAAFNKIEGTNNVAASVGLKYIDRFLYEGEEEKYNAADLFNSESDLIFKRAFSPTPSWHCHTGWFDKLNLNFFNQGIDCLNQLNIDVTNTNISGKRRKVTTIDHSAIVRTDPKENILTFITEEKSESSDRLDEIMNALHETNKMVMGNLLTKQMARRISLGKEN